MIAFACIVRGADDEAKILKDLLASVAPHVDGMFVTITQPNEKVKQVAEMFNATVSHFEWCNDFAKARAFNFAQVPKEYDYIMWGDADDTFEGIEGLREVIKENPADGYAMFYFYDHDQYGLPTVVHAKTQIVKNDGTFAWVGAIHEDLQTEREARMYFLKGMKRVHHTSEQRVDRSSARNLAIAETGDKRDPRTWWNIANGHSSLGHDTEAKEAFENFLETSQSDGEKYVAYLRLAYIETRLKGPHAGIERARQAIAIHYDYPDAYFTLGELLYDIKRYQEAVDAILEGLRKKPPIHAHIVFNPRDYDYNPLMMLAKIYWTMSKPDQSLTCLQKCKQIQPKNRALDKMIENAEEEAKHYGAVLKALQKIQKLKQPKAKLAVISKLAPEAQRHPLILRERNQLQVKETSSGKDLAYFCGFTDREWTPETVKQGIGGSEEAVIHLSREFAKAGWNVTVYNNCVEEKVYDGVTYRPWYLFNAQDKQDVAIIWRKPGVVDYDINAKTIVIDLHDTIHHAEFTEERMKKIHKIFVKSKAHRDLYPAIPDDKFVIVPNAIKPDDFVGDVERDPFLMINTSSPERGLNAAVRVFKKVKEKEPRARMVWAYGWDVYDAVHATDKTRMKFKDDLIQEMKDSGVTNLGKVSHQKIAELTLGAGVMLYPTHFYEIDCVSLRKAQLGGAVPVTSNFAAIDETVQHGYKVPSVHTKETWAPPYVIDFSEDESEDDEYVDALLQAFTWTDEQRKEMREFASRFDREYVASVWLKNI